MSGARERPLPPVPWARRPRHTVPRFPWVVIRLGAAIGLAYGLAVIAVFLAVVAIWPASSSPSLSAAKPSTSLPVATPLATSAPPTERPSRPPGPVSTKAPIPTKAPTDLPTIPPILAIRGEATFYCLPLVSPCTVGFPAAGMYAAAGAELRAALGDWRGRKVTIWRGSRHVTVTLIDSCDCGVDLYASAFLLLAPLSRGVLDVEVTWN